MSTSHASSSDDTSALVARRRPSSCERKRRAQSMPPRGSLQPAREIIYLNRGNTPGQGDLVSCAPLWAGPESTGESGSVNWREGRKGHQVQGVPTISFDREENLT